MKPGLYQDGKRIGDIERVEMNSKNVETVKYMTLESAIALAANAHRGQKDLAGEPYILHPLRVMSKFKTYEARMAAVLHDIVEDTHWTIEDLMRAQVPSIVIHAVGALTRRKDEGELYMNYINRVCQNYLATAVKIEDLRDNLDITRFKTIEDMRKYASLMRREEKALSYCLTVFQYVSVL